MTGLTHHDGTIFFLALLHACRVILNGHCYALASSTNDLERVEGRSRI